MGIVKHGLARRIGGRAKVYQAWGWMIQRCTNPKTKSFFKYDGRGINVCERWLKFENFLEDMGDTPEGMSLERIDNNGNYEPGNCRWATKKEQARNRRTSRLITIGDQTKTLAEWAEINGVVMGTAWDRLKKGWPIEDVFRKENFNSKKHKLTSCHTKKKSTS